MRRHLPLAIAIAALGAVAVAQTPVTPPPTAAMPAAEHPAPVGLALAVYPAKGKLTVTTPAFADGGDIPLENTRWGANIFPGLSWTKGPPGTQSYVVIMQDADVNYHGGPLLHWTMYDIPGSVTKLDAGMTTPPGGAQFGPNVRGPGQAYMGPHTPPGPKHHYHFAILALDEPVSVDSAMTYGHLAAAISGHVLASGEVIGLGHADPNAAPPAPATNAMAPAAAH